MMVAAAEDSHETAKELLTAGADITLRDESGETALQIARAAFSKNVTRLLRRAGAK